MTQPVQSAQAAAPLTFSAETEPRTSPLQRVQAATGLAFGLFALPHLFNTMLAAVGGDLYDAFQTRARAVYQHPIVELALISTLVVHIAAGILRARSQTLRPQSGRGPRYAGWFLATVIFGHIAFTRGPSLLAGVHPGFLGVAFAVQKFPGMSYPYFALLIVALSVHGARGAQIALGVWSGRTNLSLLRAYTVASVVIALGFLGLLGLGGQLYTTADPEHSGFAELIRPYLNP